MKNCPWVIFRGGHARVAPHMCRAVGMDPVKYVRGRFQKKEKPHAAETLVMEDLRLSGE